MDFFTSVIDRVRGFVKDARGRASSSSLKTNPIEVLKRLQREAFSDVMKLRDRQDKLERVISSKYGQGNPFQEANTHLKGMIDVAGALLFVQDDGQLAFDALDRTGIKRGTSLKFIFETVVRQKDALLTVFTAGHNNADAAQNTLVLNKIKYLACIDDCLSLILIPLGAQCNDFGIISNVSKKISLPEPPLFGLSHKYAAGLVIKGSNASASLAGLYSDSERGLESSTGGGGAAADTSFLGTFGQLSYELFEETRFTLSGLWLKASPISHFNRMGPLAMSVKRTRNSGAQAAAAATTAGPGSMSLLLEAELDESARLGGWVETQKANRSWGIFLSDTPEDDLGWSLRLERRILVANSNLSLLEGLVNVNVGKRVSLQPSLVFLMEGSKCNLACCLRANWTM